MNASGEYGRCGGAVLVAGQPLGTLLRQWQPANDRRNGRRAATGGGFTHLEGTYDSRQCSCNITGAPQLVKDIVVAGVTGGDSAHRGYLTAFDVKTGRMRWRFYTIPGPGEKGHETWPGESWLYGGGSTWMTGSYDPELNLLYWGVGNASSDINGSNRSGDNLYTASIVALDADTGKLKWYYQVPEGEFFAGGSWVMKPPPDGRQEGYLAAYDPLTGDRKWTVPVTTWIMASVLATAGDLVFTGDPEGNFFAIDARTGTRLWNFHTGAGHRGSAVTYSIGGRQYVATPTGWGSIVADMHKDIWPNAPTARPGSALVVFALPEAPQ